MNCRAQCLYMRGVHVVLKDPLVPFRTCMGFSCIGLFRCSCIKCGSADMMWMPVHSLADCRECAIGV